MHASPLNDLLLESGLISPEALERAWRRQKIYGTSLVEHLVDTQLVEEMALVELLAEKTGAPIADLNTVQTGVKRELAERHRALLLEGSPKRVAMADPLDPQAKHELEAAVGQELESLLAPLSALREKTVELYGIQEDDVPLRPMSGGGRIIEEAAQRWGLKRARAAFQRLGGDSYAPTRDSTCTVGPYFWLTRETLGRIPPGPPTHAGVCAAKATTLRGLDGLRALMEDAQVELTDFESALKVLEQLNGHGEFVVDGVHRLRDIPHAPLRAGEESEFWHPPRIENGELVFFYNSDARYQKIRIGPDYSLHKKTIGPGARPRPMRGRPYVDDAGTAQVASFEPLGDAAVTNQAAEAWRKEASYEHASVASFSRASLELMAQGAPMELLERTHQAALDELEHTRLCLEVAQALDGRQAQLGAVAALAPRSEDLAGFAVRTLREAYLPERGAVAEAQAARSLARFPPAKDALQTIIEDETRHYELAMDIIRWCLERGGALVRRALVDALQRVPSAPSSFDVGGPLQAQGLLDDASRSSIAAQASGIAADDLLQQLRPESNA